MSRFVVECNWNGPINPAGGFTRLQHQEVITEKKAKEYNKIDGIVFTDGTYMSVRTRQANYREKIKPLLGYSSLLSQVLRSGLTGRVKVADLMEIAKQ